MANDNRATIDSVETTFNIIDALHRRDNAKISELAEELDVAKSTIHRHITTLESKDAVVTDGNGVKLATKFLRIGNRIRYRSEVSEVVEDIVERLSNETAERANFFIEEFGYSVCLHRKVGERGVIAETELGKRFLMHCTAAGKAMLSIMPEYKVQEIIDKQGLPRQTSNTITTEESLMEELQEIQEQRIAYNDEENIENLRSIGVPIQVADHHPPSAITISGPAHRLSDKRIDEELREAILGAANELELKLKY